MTNEGGSIVITIESLTKLADSDDFEIRCAVGEHPHTPMHILEKLAQDEHPDVRFSLAENHNISAEILRTLACDENPYVAFRAVRTLERLSMCIENVVTRPITVFAIAS